LLGSGSLEAGWLDGVIEKGLGEGGIRRVIKGIMALRQEIEAISLAKIETLSSLRTLKEMP